MKIVFIVPIYNRIEKLKILFNNNKLMETFDFLFVDDFSDDGSFSFIKNKNYKNVEVIKSSKKDSFWRGAIDDGCRYIKSNAKYHNYDFFGFMNDDIIFSNDCDFNIFSNLDTNKIWFSPAYWYRKKIYTGGILSDSRKCNVSKLLSDIDKSDEYIAIGGFFSIFPINGLDVFLGIKLPAFVKHYHADTCYSYILKQIKNYEIKALNNFVIQVDDSDKERLCKMKFKEKISDIRSPFEWKSSIYWYLLVDDNFITFIHDVINHYIKASLWSIYYKIRSFK